MAKAGSIDIFLNANTKGFDAGVSKARKGITGLVKGFADIHGALNVVQQGFAAAGKVVGAFADQVERLDEIGDTAERLSVTADSLVKLQRAAEITGGDVDGVAKSLAILQRNLGDAAGGQGGALKALQKLGLNAQELVKLDLDESFRRIVERISEIPTPAERASMAADLFGKSASNLTGLITQGSSAFAEAATDVKVYGAALDDVRMNSIDKTKKAMEQWEMASKGFWDELAMTSAPAMAELYKGATTMLLMAKNNPMAAAKGVADPLGLWKAISAEVERQTNLRFTPAKLPESKAKLLDPDERLVAEARAVRETSMATRKYWRQRNWTVAGYEAGNLARDWDRMLEEGFVPSAPKGANAPAKFSNRFGIQDIGIGGSGPRSIGGMSGGAGALEFGTAAAYSAIQQSQREDEMRKLQRQEVDESKKQTKVLEEMRGLFRNTVQLVELGLQG